MTRYARGNGSKGCNFKQKCTSTSWRLLKGQLSSKRAPKGPKKDGECSRPLMTKDHLLEKGGSHSWFDFGANGENVACGKIRLIRKCRSENKNHEKILAKSKETLCSRVTVEEKIVSGCGKKSASNMKGIFGKMDTFDEEGIQRKGKRVSSFKVKLSEEGLKDLRRQEKALKREKKKVCFCCRRWGHQLADCPEFSAPSTSDMSPPAGGLCYHCGSTEHNVNQCGKKGVNSHKFARCFVCGEDGHLARQCLENPKGKYPKGGSCRTCGEISHLSSECPKNVSQTTDTANILSCTTHGLVDCLPEDTGRESQQQVSPRKIIQF